MPSLSLVHTVASCAAPYRNSLTLGLIRPLWAGSDTSRPRFSELIARAESQRPFRTP